LYLIDMYKEGREGGRETKKEGRRKKESGHLDV
jgi:hypothetical protein